MSKKLGYFIVQHEDENQLKEDYSRLMKCDEDYFDIVSTDKNYHYFTHIFVKGIEVRKFKETDKQYIKLNTYVDFGDRYDKEDILHMGHLIERILKRSIDFCSKDNTVRKFFETTQVLY